MTTSTGSHLAAASAAELLAQFIASPTGHRFRLCDPGTLWSCLRPAVRLAAAIELTGLADRRALNIQYIGHGYGDAADDGRWLQMAKYFLPSAPRLEIAMRSDAEVERGRVATGTSLADYVANLAPARRRTVAREELFAPLMGKADLAIFSPRALILHPRYRPVSEVVASGTHFVWSDESDAATLAVTDWAAEFGAVLNSQWVDALDDPEEPNDTERPRFAHGALLTHLVRDALHVPDEEAWHRIRNMVTWSVGALVKSVHSNSSTPVWPGAYIPFVGESGSRGGVIVANPAFLIDAATGKPLIPIPVPYQLPADLLSRHPGQPNPLHRLRPRSEELAWAAASSAAMEVYEASLAQANENRKRQVIAQLEAMSERPPPPLPPPSHLNGLCALVEHDDHVGLRARILLRNANPNQRGPGGITPMILAVRIGQDECLKVLLESHADASLRDDHGWTAQAYAAFNGDIAALTMLVGYPRATRPRLGGGFPESVFCAALMHFHHDCAELQGLTLPDAAAAIEAWRTASVEFDLATLLQRVAAPSESTQAPIPTPDALVPERPSLPAAPSPTKPPVHGPPPPTPQAPSTTLAHAVRQALSLRQPGGTGDMPLPIQYGRILASANDAAPSAQDAAPAPLVESTPTLVESTPASIEIPPPPACDQALPEASPQVALLPTPTPPVTTPKALPSHPVLARPLATMSVVATVAGTLGHLSAEHDPAAAGRAARDAVIAWLRVDKRLPLPAHVEEIFQLDLPDATVISDAVPGLWTLRFDDRDRAVAGRTWRTEVVIATNAERALASVRLVRISPSADDDTIVSPSIPKVVARIAGQVGISDAGVPLRAEPWFVSSEENITALTRLLLNAGRLQPVLVVTSPEPAWIGKPQDPSALVARLHGFAHVLIVHPSMTFSLSRELGRQLGVFGDACRLYRPGFTINDDVQSNPLFLRRADTPVRPLVARIVEAAAGLAPTGVTDDDVPTFAFARALMAQARQAAGGSIATHGPSTDLVQGLDQAIITLTAERDSWQESYGERDAMARSREDELLIERESLREEVQRLRSLNYHLRSQNDQLRVGISTRAGTEPAPLVYPDTWDALESWAADVLGDDVVLTSKAIRAARKSHFQNIPLAYQVLHLLKEYYLPVRMDRTPELLQALKARCNELGVEISDTGQAVDNHRYRDSYKATWSGRQYTLNQHVSGSSSRDRALQFRLYFAYDDDQCAVIVGSFPEHLENFLTRH